MPTSNNDLPDAQPLAVPTRPSANAIIDTAWGQAVHDKLWVPPAIVSVFRPSSSPVQIVTASTYVVALQGSITPDFAGQRIQIIANWSVLVSIAAQCFMRLNMTGMTTRYAADTSALNSRMQLFLAPIVVVSSTAQFNVFLEVTATAPLTMTPYTDSGCELEIVKL